MQLLISGAKQLGGVFVHSANTLSDTTAERRERVQKKYINHGD